MCVIRVGAGIVTLLGAALPAVAEPQPPAQCGFSISFDRPNMRGTFTGAVTSIQPGSGGSRTKVRLDDGSGGVEFKVSTELALPFKVDDTITLHAQCGGWHQVCDARIDDAAGETLVIAAAAGSDRLSQGWTTAVGKVTSSSKNTNAPRKSIRREHALRLMAPARSGSGASRITATLTSGRCTAIRHGALSWLATGFAISWEGLRPPEGVDYKTYSLVRWMP